MAGLARDAATARTTIEGYLGILQDTLVATLLPACEAKLRVRERQHPKLYWVDPGLARAAKQQLGPVAAEERGPLLEGLVLTILRAHNGDSELFEEASYWAPAQARQTEVDFLLRRGRGLRPRVLRDDARWGRLARAWSGARPRGRETVGAFRWRGARWSLAAEVTARPGSSPPRGGALGATADSPSPPADDYATFYL